LATQIEAILYIKGKPLSIEEIVACLNSNLAARDALDLTKGAVEGGRGEDAPMLERDAIEDALIELINDYAYRDSALEIVETSAGYSLQLKTAYGNLVKELVPAEIGTGALRTLAAIALKNPILQTELIDLRGSSAYQQVTELVELGFIRKRPQSEGRSYWLEVTDKFHQYFEVDRANLNTAVPSLQRRSSSREEAKST
jgi:segregation and condensation protein B